MLHLLLFILFQTFHEKDTHDGRNEMYNIVNGFRLAFIYDDHYWRDFDELRAFLDYYYVTALLHDSGVKHFSFPFLLVQHFSKV